MHIMILAIFLLLFLTVNSTLSVNPRIINGEAVSDPGQFPWQAAIYLRKPTSVSFCGGSLISNDWIITAAQCIAGTLDYTVYLGTNLLSDIEMRTNYTVIRAVRHPQFTEMTLENDIGLLQLSKSVTYTDYIAPIPVAAEFVEVGIPVVVSGYGAVTDDELLSDHLRFALMFLVPIEECARYYPHMDDGKLCAIGSVNQNVCTGDVGGPLVNGLFGPPTLIGVISFFQTMGCERGQPSGFTSISAHRLWISEISGV